MWEICFQLIESCLWTGPADWCCFSFLTSISAPNTTHCNVHCNMNCNAQYMYIVHCTLLIPTTAMYTHYSALHCTKCNWVYVEYSAVKWLYAAHTAAVNFIPENFIFDIWQKLFLLHSSFFFNNIFGIFKKIIESVIKLPSFLINQSVILRNPLH